MQRSARLTEGGVVPTLLRFSIPFLLSNLLQALYGAADLFMVGRFSTSAGVSAVATGGQVMQTVTGLAIGLTTGGTVVVAQAVGARRGRTVADVTATVFVVFGALSLVVTGAVVGLLDPICAAMQVPPQAMAPTRQYLSICAAGIVCIVGYNAVSGILRGLGDSRTPLCFMAVACAVNVAGDLLLVGALRLGAVGAALATVLAQAVSLALAWVHLARRGMVRTFVASRPGFRLGAARRVLGVGLPIALQEGLVNVSFLLITAILNGMGLTASAAVGVAEKLIVFSMLPTTAFASAVAAMAAQNFGAGRRDRARACLWGGVGLSLCFGLGCLLAAQLWGEGLVGLFSSDPEVIRAGARYLASYSLDCVAVCFVFCMNAYFSGVGRPQFPLVHSCVATFAVRVPLAWLLSRTRAPSLFAVGFSAPAATLLSLALCRWYLSRLDREQRDGPPG